MKQTAYFHGLVLGAFCLGLTTLMALTHSLTVDEIAARVMEDRQASLGQVIPPTLHDNNPVADVLTLSGPDGRELTVYRARRGSEVTAVAYEVAGSGYAGPIKLMLGVGRDGRVLGARVLAHQETPGLGDKIEIKKGNWIMAFDGLALGDPEPAKWKVKKDGGVFDQFTGATITPRAVVGAIRGGLDFFAAHQTELTEAH